MESETPRQQQQQQHRDNHCHSETSELKNKNVLQSREREASHITDRTQDLSKMLQNFFLKLFVILQLSAGPLSVLKESNQQLKDKTDTRQRAGKYASELQLISFSICQQRRAKDAMHRPLVWATSRELYVTKTWWVTVFMVIEGSSCDLRATFNWTVTFVQVGFSISHHSLTWDTRFGRYDHGRRCSDFPWKTAGSLLQLLQNVHAEADNVSNQDRTRPVDNKQEG